MDKSGVAESGPPNGRATAMTEYKLVVVGGKYENKAITILKKLNNV